MKIDFSSLDKWRLPAMEEQPRVVAAGVAPVEMRLGVIWVRFAVKEQGAGRYVLVVGLKSGRRALSNVEVKHFARLHGLKIDHEDFWPGTERRFVLRERQPAPEDRGRHLPAEGREEGREVSA